MVSFLEMCNCQWSCHLTARQKIRKDSVLMSFYTRGSLCQAQSRIDGSTLLVSTNAMTTTVRYYHISMDYFKSECTKLIIAGSLSRSSNKDCIKILQVCRGYWVQVLIFRISQDSPSPNDFLYNQLDFHTRSLYTTLKDHLSALEHLTSVLFSPSCFLNSTF